MEEPSALFVRLLLDTEQEIDDGHLAKPRAQKCNDLAYPIPLDCETLLMRCEETDIISCSPCDTDRERYLSKQADDLYNVRFIPRGTWGLGIGGRASVVNAHHQSARKRPRSLRLTCERASIMIQAMAASIQVTIRISGPLPPYGAEPVTAMRILQSKVLTDFTHPCCHQAVARQ